MRKFGKNNKDYNEAEEEEVDTGTELEDTEEEPAPASTRPPKTKARKAPRPPKAAKQPKEKKAKAPKEFKRSIGDFFKSRVVIGIICVVTAILVVFVGGPIVQGIISERVPVIVVSQNIPKGTLITSEMVQSGEVASIDRPETAVLGYSGIVGAYAAVDLLENDVVTSPKLTWELPMVNAYLYDLPVGKQAISVEVKGLAEGLSAKLKEGDIVTVYAVFNESDAKELYEAVQPLELKYVKVLAVSNSSANDVDVDEPYLVDGTENEKIPATITLLVGDLQGAALAGLNQNATIHVSLVSRGDNSTYCDALLAAQDEYIVKLEEEMKEKEEEEENEDGEGESETVSEVSFPDVEAGEGGDAAEDGEDTGQEETEASGSEDGTEESGEEVNG